MNVLTTYLISTLAFNVSIAILMFAALWASMRKRRELTFLRGTAVLLIGWVFGSILILIIHLLFAIGGTEVQNGPIEAPVAILMIISVMYAAYRWLSKERTVVIP